jgi:uncharacterized protein
MADFRWMLLALSLSCLAAQGRAASFDCAGARSNAEKRICGDPVLSALDETLAQAFAAAAEVVPRTTLLRAEQRDWIAKQRDTADDVAAMRLAYETRIQVLRELADDARSRRDEAVSGPLGETCMVLPNQPYDCRVEESGTVEAGLSYQLQAYYDGDVRAVGAVVVVAPADSGKFRPVVWDADDSAHYAAPRIIARPDGKLLELRGSLEGTGDLNASSLYREADGRWREIDASSWLDEMSRRLPKGRSVVKGVYPNWEKMTADTPIWRDRDGNCCPSGGSAHVTLALQDDRIVLTGLRVSPRLLP